MGQQAAFTTVYDRYWPSIFYFVRKFIPDISQAEDITADTFIKLWHRREDFDNEKSIASFLHTTARNASIDCLRAEKRNIRNSEELLYLLQQDQYNHPQDDIKTEVLRQVLLEMEKLPSKTKRVFILSYLDGKTNEEIASLLGIRNQSVRNHKARTIKLLRLAIASKNWVFVLPVFLL